MSNRPRLPGTARAVCLATSFSFMFAACGGGGSDGATPAAPTVGAPPQTLQVAERETYAFSAKVLPETATLQWRRNGVPIAGATGVRISGPATTADDGARFDVVATSAGGSTTSSAGELRVGRWAETVTPLSAVSLYDRVATAIGADGGAVVVWCEQRAGGVRAVAARNYRVATGAWSAATTIGVNCVGVLDVAMDAASNAYVAWTDWDGSATSNVGVSMKRFDAAANAWEATFIVPAATGRNADDVKVRAGGTGVAAVVFGTTGGTTADLRFARYSGGAWRPDNRLGTMSAGADFDAAIGANDDLVTVRRGATGIDVLAQLHRLSDDTITLPETLASGSDAMSVPVLSQSDRFVTAAWASASAARVEARVDLWQGTGWAPAGTLAWPAGAAPFDARGFRLLGYALSSAGAGNVAIEVQQPSGVYRRLAATRSADGAFQADIAAADDALAETTSATSMGEPPSFAADAQGIVSRVVPVRGTASSIVRVERFRPDDGWRGGIAETAVTGRLGGVDHATNAQGRMLVAWTEFAGTAAAVRTRMLLPLRP